MTLSGPSVIVLAGPNGAGKSTAAPALLQGALAVPVFVNADVVAQGLAGHAAAAAALAAGRVVRQRLRALAHDRASFAFETTLAGTSLAIWLAELVESGYRFRLVFIRLRSADIAVQRVAERVAHGGHDVPQATVRRRYRQGLRNLGEVFLPLATEWQVYDNSGVGGPVLVAAGDAAGVHVHDPVGWQLLRSSFEARPRE